MNPPPVALLVAAGSAQRLLARHVAPTPASRFTSVLVGAAAAAVLVAPVVEFRRRRTTVDPRAKAVPSQLVLTGINAYTRNPMYVGMTGLLVANAALRPTASVLLPVVGFAAWMDRRQIPAEEHALQAEFGEEFEAYCSRVPRWIGIGTRLREI